MNLRVSSNDPGFIPMGSPPPGGYRTAQETSTTVTESQRSSSTETKDLGEYATEVLNPSEISISFIFSFVSLFSQNSTTLDITNDSKFWIFFTFCQLFSF